VKALWERLQATRAGSGPPGRGRAWRGSGGCLRMGHRLQMVLRLGGGEPHEGARWFVNSTASIGIPG